MNVCCFHMQIQYFSRFRGCVSVLWAHNSVSSSLSLRSCWRCITLDAAISHPAGMYSQQLPGNWVSYDLYHNGRLRIDLVLLKNNHLHYYYESAGLLWATRIETAKYRSQQAHTPSSHCLSFPFLLKTSSSMVIVFHSKSFFAYFLQSILTMLFALV